MAKQNTISEIDKEIERLQKKKYDILDKKYNEKRKAEEKKVYNEHKEAIEYLKKFVGKWCKFGKDVIDHFYWKPFPDYPAEEYDYVRIFFVTYISYYNKAEVCICGKLISTSDTYAEIEENFQGNYRFDYIEGTYKPTSNEKYQGGLRILTDKEVKEAIKFVKEFNNNFVDKLLVNNTKNTFNVSLKDTYNLTEEDQKKLEENAKKLKIWNDEVAKAYNTFMKAEAKFREAIYNPHLGNYFTVTSKFVRNQNGNKILKVPIMKKDND